MDTNTIWRKGANAGGGEGSHRWFSQGDAHGSHTAQCTQCAMNSAQCALNSAQCVLHTRAADWNINAPGGG